MQTAARPAIDLNESERQLIVELLERERGELPAEIRRTSTPGMRDQLRERLENVERLLHRLSPAA
jgi:hypothetical protein